MSVLNPREADLLTLIRRRGPLSRRELHQHTGLRPNTVGDIVGRMLNRGILREATADATTGPGRPRMPLEIDTTARDVVGIAMEPGRVTACRLNLMGQRLSSPQERTTHQPTDIVEAACELVRANRSDRTLAVGISTPGFVDAENRVILTSSATFRQLRTSIAPVYEAAEGLPVFLENDMHAEAAYWLLSQDTDASEDVLLVSVSDGALGAALLIDGKPNRGCISGANELGHTRFNVETEPCFCGHSGCLERICSTPFLQKLAHNDTAHLIPYLSSFDPDDPAVRQITHYLALAIANTIILIRPHRAVLTGQVADCPLFTKNLLSTVRNYLLPPLADRVRIDTWDRPPVTYAEAAAWLALAAIYHGSWD